MPRLVIVKLSDGHRWQLRMANARVKAAWLRNGRIRYLLRFSLGFIGFVFAEHLTSDIQVRTIETRFEPKKISVAGRHPFINYS